MSTYEEIEAQIETELCALEQKLAELDAEEVAEEAKLESDTKAAAAETQATLKQQSAEMHAKYEAARTALNQKIEALDQKLKHDLQAADAEVARAQGEAKKDLDAQRASSRAHREKAQVQLRASYTAQVKHIESQIDDLEDWAASTSAEVRTKVDAQVSALRRQVAAARQELEQLKQAQQAAWEERKAEVERAMAGLRKSLDEATADFFYPVPEPNATRSELIVITKDPDGRVKIKQRRDRNVKRMALFGMLLGGLVGAVTAGPVGMAAGAVAGGVTGGGGVALIKTGFPKEFLQDVQAQMTPGTSALVVLIDHVWLDSLDMTLNQLGGEVLRQTVTDAMVQEMITSQAAS